MNTELQPCPMPECSGRGKFVKHSAGIAGSAGFDSWHAVACSVCGITLGACDRRFRNKADAAMAWNRRAAQPVSAGLTDEQIIGIANDHGWQAEIGNLLFGHDDLIGFSRALLSAAQRDTSADARDAARYRWLKTIGWEHGTPNHAGVIPVFRIQFDSKDYGWTKDENRIDAAIDAAIAASREGS